MAYDWRDALRRKLPHDLASGFPALRCCAASSSSSSSGVRRRGRIRVGVASPVDALAAMMGAHRGASVAAAVRPGADRAATAPEGAFVPAPGRGGRLAAPAPSRQQRTERTRNEPNRLATNRTNCEQT